MSSSQPVTTPNAINFTPDNKHCYAYSGVKLVGTSATEVMTFTTNSEYLVGQVSVFCISDTTDDIEFIVKFNDVTILETNTTSFKDYAPYTPLPLIIPPFTVVTMEAFNQASGSKNVSMNYTGKAFGMADVGYQ
jgi:hypothetical protein